jgi:ribosomal protein S27AE
MAVYITKYSFEWKKVKGNIPTKKLLCPRCNNSVEYFLAWDGDTIGWGKLSLPTSKAYVYKCPICPQYEVISQELAKALIKESK